MSEELQGRHSEGTDARPSGTDHLRKRLLVDLCRDRLRLSFLVEVRQEKKYPGQTLFTGIEQLIDQIVPRRVEITPTFRASGVSRSGAARTCQADFRQIDCLRKTLQFQWP